MHLQLKIPLSWQRVFLWTFSSVSTQNNHQHLIKSGDGVTPLVVLLQCWWHKKYHLKSGTCHKDDDTDRKIAIHCSTLSCDVILFFIWKNVRYHRDHFLFFLQFKIKCMWHVNRYFTTCLAEIWWQEEAKWKFNDKIVIEKLKCERYENSQNRRNMSKSVETVFFSTEDWMRNKLKSKWNRNDMSLFHLESKGNLIVDQMLNEKCVQTL